ncbi:hypothetical protein TIFTF001_017492 [Ficus carica]|uniref:Uncharacterized protein n=1 Tax=Ficus carica TaxID=3494 RepID=A0AA88D719_FICCA|nr:hypothetical protein TIFTF001_017492 [Ficus carica]
MSLVDGKIRRLIPIRPHASAFADLQRSNCDLSQLRSRLLQPRITAASVHDVVSSNRGILVDFASDHSIAEDLALDRSIVTALVELRGDILRRHEEEIKSIQL